MPITNIVIILLAPATIYTIGFALFHKRGGGAGKRERINKGPCLDYGQAPEILPSDFDPMWADLADQVKGRLRQDLEDRRK